MIFFVIEALLIIIFKLDRFIARKKKPIIEGSLLFDIMSIYQNQKALI